MKRKIFLIFPALLLFITLINLFYGNVFESLLWLLATVLVSLIFMPIAFKAEEKDVPVYQVFAPYLLIPIFFSIFAIMDFRKIELLNEPQAVIYGIFAGIFVIGSLMLLMGPNQY